MVTTKQPGGQLTITSQDRHQHALAALALVTESDVQLVAQEYGRLFSPHMRLVGFARQLCPLYAQQLTPGAFFAFEEKQLEVDHLVESGDRVIAHVQFRGRHQAPASDPTTTRWYTARGIVVFRFADGYIDQAWAVLQWH